MATELLPTAVLCDVAPEPIALLPRVRRLWKGATLVGPALTVWSPPGEHLSVRHALEQAREGEVIVVDCKGSLATASGAPACRGSRTRAASRGWWSTAP